MATLSGLLELLPKLDVRAPLLELNRGRTIECPDHGYEGQHRFIAPPLEEKVAVVDASTSVVIVSAPAAVGKTTLARELASQANACVWNLATFQVADSTFTGTIADLFGYSEASRVYEQLERGDLLIVLDALDEAEVSAHDESFEAFLDDLGRQCQTPRPRPSLILFAREPTAELIATSFELHDVPYAHYQIDYFGEDAAKQFIQVRLGDSWSRLEEAREALFQSVYTVLGLRDDPWSDERVASFLGYAPVLEVMADYLGSEANPQKVVQEIEQLEGSSSQWAILQRIVVGLLDREQTKFENELQQSSFGGEAETVGWNQWSALYTADEQCERVLAAEFGADSASIAPAVLPTKLQAEYAEAIGRKVVAHPFRDTRGGSRFVNVVFEEYLYAWFLASGQDIYDRLAPSVNIGRKVIHPIARKVIHPRPDGSSPATSQPTSVQS